MVQLQRLNDGIPCLCLIKMETFNPGHSIKDRMAVKMVEDAEKDGRLKPGGTIIECTSGNTGMGLALAGIVKGYSCIFTTTDKQSKEKVDLLKALGAEVIVCPTNVGPNDPRSYYSVAERLSKEVPNSFWCNQYDNLSNREAHYESTGPEIWEQTDGRITHLIVGVGTGGTISGTARYLKERNPAIKIWGVDTYGSVFKKYHETGEFDTKEIYPYITEGIGEDILPQNVDFSLIDHFEKVSDKDAALVARRLAREEGLLLGYSAGSAVGALLQLKDKLSPDDVVVVIIHDHGSRYVGKIYNDDWMRERGFLQDDMTVNDLIRKKEIKEFIGIEASKTLREAFKLMKDYDLSQLPVTTDNEIIGAVTESLVLNLLLENPIVNADKRIEEVMSEPFPWVEMDTPLKRLNRLLDKRVTAILCKDQTGQVHILTQYDVIHAL